MISQIAQGKANPPDSSPASRNHKETTLIVVPANRKLVNLCHTGLLSDFSPSPVQLGS